MTEEKLTCKSCGKELANPMMYRCISCFAQYCDHCDGSEHGVRCPKCGQTGRMVLDQRKK